MKKKFLLVTALLIALTACGSSGGGGGGGGTPATPIPSTPDPDPGTVTTPDAPYVPFNKSDPHKASTVKSSGINGTGVTIGIIDTGFDTANAEFKDSLNNPRISTDPSFPGNTNAHGSLVADIAGGKTIGMAPNVKIKAISAGVTCDDGTDTCVDTTLPMYQSLYNDGVRIFNQSFGADKATGTAKKSEFPLSDPVIDFFYKRATTDSLFIWPQETENLHSLVLKQDFLTYIRFWKKDGLQLLPLIPIQVLLLIMPINAVLHKTGV